MSKKDTDRLKAIFDEVDAEEREFDRCFKQLLKQGCKQWLKDNGYKND